MAYRLAADVLVLLHLGFIVFVLFGASLILWRRWLVWPHGAALAWAAAIEIEGWICPLTPWEQQLRWMAGDRGYTGGFIEHYLIPVIYPAGLTPAIQLGLGIFVVVWNSLLYGIAIRRLRRR
ncbi:MAG: DUF2784 domain-containing protein [Methylococcaceae bacterium]|nr:DUF2784 domain-containing protein [Desulfuromonas sp.]NJD08161.1 DUF2784 domain-containing protein [Methylococcaceae bacterium]